MDEQWDEAMTPWRKLARTADPAQRARWVEQAHAQVAHEQPLAEPSSSRWVIAGDTHGLTHYVTTLISLAAAAGMDRVLILGDTAGTRAEQVEGFLDVVSLACTQKDVTVLFLDGNHDQHLGLLDRCPIDLRTGTRPVRPRVHHLPRGLRWSWGDVRYAVAGGAVSVDRSQRTEGLTVFTDTEELSEQQVTQISTDGPCEVLFTHDRPGWVETALGEDPDAWWEAAPPVWKDVDLHRSRAHQQRLDRLATALQPRWHLHGHLHRRYDLISSDTPWGGPCRITGLANEGQVRGNRIVVSTRPELSDLNALTFGEL